MSDTSRAAVEVSKSFALVTLLCLGSVVLAVRLGAAQYAQLGVAAVLFYFATRGADAMPGGPRRAGITMGGLLVEPSDEAPKGMLSVLRDGIVPTLKELALALIVAALIFPPFFFGYVAYFDLEGTVEMRVPIELATLTLSQLVLVAIPEEAYFRGYLQTRLEDARPSARTLLGAPFPITAIVVQAAAFALLHFVAEPNPARLAVFFPGLVFGALRALRGGIGAAVFFHALCNLYSETLAMSVR